MWDGIPKIKIHCCITIEARVDEEMNEVALGTCSIACRLRWLCWMAWRVLALFPVCNCGHCVTNCAAVWSIAGVCQMGEVQMEGCKPLPGFIDDGNGGHFQ